MKPTQTQFVALLLIAFASLCIVIGSHYGWHDLNAFAVAFGGAGVGILTVEKNDKHDAEPPA